MFKLWLLPIAFLGLYGISEGLECYHCFSGLKSAVGPDFVACNSRNLTASNTMICSNANCACVLETVEIQYSKERQIWRTYSNGISDPCDPNNLPPGVKMINCKSCKTDRCNLIANEEQQSFTFNINANVNLYIRQ